MIANKIHKILIYVILLFTLHNLFSCSGKNENYNGKRTFFINSKKGSDSNSGLSKDKPFKTLSKLQNINVMAGDKILIASGNVFKGSLILKNIEGTSEDPIIISSYGKGAKPLINAKGYLNGILLENCSFIEIKNISITAEGKTSNKDKSTEGDMRCGIKINISKDGNYSHIHIKNIDIYNIFFENTGVKRSEEEVRTANGTQKYGFGIRIFNNHKNSQLSNIKISNCKIRNVSHTGIKFTASRRSDLGYGVKNIEISGNKILYTGGPGIQMSGISDCIVSKNTVDHSGSNNDARKWGRGSGLWTWGSNNILIEHNKFLNANGPGDSAGAHIDFNCSNVIMQYNLSVNNAGGFCEILGNNYNCSYRYNVSINDGYRKKGVNGAFQEGKIIWLSGYSGKKSKRKGPFNSYIYNNTIYVKKDIVAKIAIDKNARGVLIANNIFYLEGSCKLVKGDQYKPEEDGKTRIKNVVFKNNIYLNRSNWPENAPIQDKEPIFGDPKFKDPGGVNIKDYIPQNIKLIKDKGVHIQKLPGDKTGLKNGLKVKKDILGNNIINKPDIGAIEI
jgi:hypothetical protein